MRLATTLGKSVDGKWHVLALPQESYQMQKDAAKALHKAGGKLKIGKSEVQLDEVLVFNTDSARKYRYHPGTTLADVQA